MTAPATLQERPGSEDWIKTRTWDLHTLDPATGRLALVTTVPALLEVLGIGGATLGQQHETVAAFMRLPAAQPMPGILRAALSQHGFTLGTQADLRKQAEHVGPLPSGWIEHEDWVAHEFKPGPHVPEQPHAHSAEPHGYNPYRIPPGQVHAGRWAPGPHAHPSEPAGEVHPSGPPSVVPGQCEHGCGTPTKGKFAPGHDAKLKAQLNRNALEPGQGREAQAEMHARGWRTSADPAVIARAGEPGFLLNRVRGRISQVGAPPPESPTPPAPVPPTPGGGSTVQPPWPLPFLDRTLIPADGQHETHATPASVADRMGVRILAGDVVTREWSSIGVGEPSQSTEMVVIGGASTPGRVTAVDRYGGIGVVKGDTLTVTGRLKQADYAELGEPPPPSTHGTGDLRNVPRFKSAKEGAAWINDNLMVEGTLSKYVPGRYKEGTGYLPSSYKEVPRFVHGTMQLQVMQAIADALAPRLAEMDESGQSFRFRQVKFGIPGHPTAIAGVDESGALYFNRGAKAAKKWEGWISWAKLSWIGTKSASGAKPWWVTNPVMDERGWNLPNFIANTLDHEMGHVATWQAMGSMGGNTRYQQEVWDALRAAEYPIQWKPSQYSAETKAEWYAEMFNAWIEGFRDDIPRTLWDWMNMVYGRHFKATAAANRKPWEPQ